MLKTVTFCDYIHLHLSYNYFKNNNFWAYKIVLPDDGAISPETYWRMSDNTLFLLCVCILFVY